MTPRRATALLLLLAGCQAGPVGPNAWEGALRLPDVIGGYRRAAPPAMLAANGAVAGSFNAYEQLGGPGRGVVQVPEAPEEGGVAAPESPAFGRAFDQALEGARIAAAGRGAEVTVRDAAIIRRDGEAILRCWRLESAGTAAVRIIALCMGVVVDRYVQVVVRTADTPGEWHAAVTFAAGALSALRAGGPALRAGGPAGRAGDEEQGSTPDPPPGWRVPPAGPGRGAPLRT